MIPQSQDMPRNDSSADLSSLNNTRAAQRKQRLLEIEKEQRMEEAEALKMTDEQRQLLSSCFKSVKIEFADLDGLKWTRTALWKRHLQAQRNANRLRRLMPHFGSSNSPTALDAGTPAVTPPTTISAEFVTFMPSNHTQSPQQRPPSRQDKQQLQHPGAPSAQTVSHHDPLFQEEQHRSSPSLPGTRPSLKALFTDASNVAPTLSHSLSAPLEPGVIAVPPSSNTDDQTIRGLPRVANDLSDNLNALADFPPPRSSTDTIRPRKGIVFTIGDDTELDDPFAPVADSGSEPPTPTPFRRNPSLPDMS